VNFGGDLRYFEIGKSRPITVSRLSFYKR